MRISDWSSDVCSSDRIIVVAAASNRREPGQARCARHADIVARGPCVCLCGEKLGIVLDRDRDGLGRRSGQPRQGRRLLEVARGQADEAEIIRSEEHTSELQSLMRISYAVFCLKKKQTKITKNR